MSNHEPNLSADLADAAESSRPHPRSRLISVACASVVILTTVVSRPVSSEEVFLTIGGGPEPASNQVSIEKCVELFASVLEETCPAAERMTFFADGDIAKRDVQFLDPNDDPSVAMRWVARLIGDESELSMRYRDSELGNVTGPARKAYLKQTFFELADRLTAGDRLVIYVAAHGGPPEDDYSSYGYDDDFDADDYYSSYASAPSNVFNTTIALWNNESLSAEELSLWLDDFDPEVEVVMIMAQCFSGGFARTLFHSADPKRAWSPARRCGFFSQRHTLPSTGCTPLVDETEYEDYSTHLLQAIRGADAEGTTIHADIDGDGQVSMREAHAHAMLTADSMDVPLTTSDMLLRKFSKIGDIPEASDDETSGESPGFFRSLFGGGKADDKTTPPRGSANDRSQSLHRGMTIDQIAGRADSIHGHVMDELSSELNVDADTTVAKLTTRSRRLRKAAADAETRWAQQQTVREGIVQEIYGAAVREYPELESNFHPMIVSICQDHDAAERFVHFIQTYPGTQAFETADEKTKRLETKSEKADNRSAKFRRLVATVESSMLLQNLDLEASPAIANRVREVLEMEGKPLSRCEASAE